MPRIVEPIQAFNGGHSLWMIANDPKSQYYQRINWLTHFKLSDHELHQTPQMAPALEQLMETCEIQKVEIPRKGPLLVPIEQWLPAQWLMLIPYDSTKQEDFIQNLKIAWEQFQYPSLRLFVPSGIKSKTLESLWQQHKLSNDVAWVFEKDSVNINT